MLEFQESLKDSGLPVEHFDGVIADPPTDVVTAGVNMAKKLGAIVDPEVTVTLLASVTAQTGETHLAIFSRPISR